MIPLIMLIILHQGMFSASSSVPMASTVSDLSDDIHTTVAVGGDGLMKHISQLLDLVNKKQEKLSHPNAAHSSLIFLELNQFLSEGTNAFKVIILCQGKRDVTNLLQGVRTTLCYRLCFCGPKFFLEIRDCFYRWRGVGSIIKQFKKATELIVEAFIICCGQIITAIMWCTHTNTSTMAAIMCCGHTNTSKF